MIEGLYDDVKVPTEEDIRLLEEISREDHERSIEELKKHFWGGKPSGKR